MKVGLKARFSDLDDVLNLHPDFIEFHFSDKDTESCFQPKNKYPISCIIHLPEIWKGYLIDITSVKEENKVLPLNESIRIVQQAINKSEKFFKHFNNTTNYLVLHAGGMTYEKESPKDSHKNNEIRIETLIKSFFKLKTENSEILIENLPPYPWYFGGQWNTNVFMDAEEIDKICRITKKKMCYDVSHSKLYCNYSNKDFYEQVKLFKKNMAHVHIADATGTDGEGIQIDEGEIDFDQFFKLMKDYHGTIVNEVWMGYLNDFAGFKIANQKIKKYLSKHR